MVGKNILNYDSMLVLAHFKGHPMGGYGGALKQLSIGCASRAGKALIHSAGKTDDRYETWKQHASSVAFPEAMADAAKTVVEHFAGKIAFVNVMKNLSVDCDCCAVAEDPCMEDIGILASLDPVAIDQACIDLGHTPPTTRARSTSWSASPAATASTPSRPRPSWATALASTSWSSCKGRRRVGRPTSTSHETEGGTAKRKAAPPLS